jgi:hypothetical protein
MAVTTPDMPTLHAGGGLDWDPWKSATALWYGQISILVTVACARTLTQDQINLLFFFTCFTLHQIHAHVQQHSPYMTVLELFHGHDS